MAVRRKACVYIDQFGYIDFWRGFVFICKYYLVCFTIKHCDDIVEYIYLGILAEFATQINVVSIQDDISKLVNCYTP